MIQILLCIHKNIKGNSFRIKNIYFEKKNLITNLEKKENLTSIEIILKHSFYDSLFNYYIYLHKSYLLELKKSL